MNGRTWRRYLLVGALATVPIVAIPDSWWYTAWYDTLGLSAVASILTDAFPSAADGFYLAGYLPLAAGLLLFIRARTPGRDWASLIDLPAAGRLAAGHACR